MLSQTESIKSISKDKVLTFLKEHKEEFFSEFNLVKIGIFGSIARDEVTKESDIDLIVEFRPGTKNLFEKKSRIKAIIQQQFNREVDICREKYIKPYFKSQILNSTIYV